WRLAAERVEYAEQAEARAEARTDARAEIRGRDRVEPEFFAAMVADGRSAAAAGFEDDGEDDDALDFSPGEAVPPPAPAQERVQNFRSPAPGRVENPAPRPAPGARVQR